MAPEAPTSTAVDDGAPGSSNTVVNAFIGAVVSVVVGFFVPFFSPIVGGGVAAYLDGSRDSERGARVGALSGVFAAIPIVLVGLVVVSFLLGAPRAAIGILGIVVVAFGLLLTVGLSALGGILGVYVRDEL